MPPTHHQCLTFRMMYDSTPASRKTSTNFDSFLRSVEQPRENFLIGYLTSFSRSPFSDMNSSTSSLSTMSSETISTKSTTSPLHIFSKPKLPEDSETDPPLPQISKGYCQQSSVKATSHTRHSMVNSTQCISSRRQQASAHQLQPIQRPKPLNQPCRNCHQTHEHLGPEIHSETCIFISAQAHRSASYQLHQPSARAAKRLIPLTLRLPASILESEPLFRSIWRCFEAIKKENDFHRNLLLSPPTSPTRQLSLPEDCLQKVKAKAKTPLREEAPLIWLKWKSADELRKGQTRNEKNWEDIWLSLLSVSINAQNERSQGLRTLPVGWVTVSLPADQLYSLIMDLDRDEYEMHTHMQQLDLKPGQVSPEGFAWPDCLSTLSIYPRLPFHMAGEDGGPLLKHERVFHTLPRWNLNGSAVG